MDFTFDDGQAAVRELAEQIFQGRATVERVKAVEAGEDRFDRELWVDLAKAELLGLCLPEAYGGSGLGLVELCLVLEQQGRVVAPVPVLATVTAAMAVAEFGTDDQQAEWLPRVARGDAVLTSALEPTADPSRLISVPWAHVADRVLVPVGGELHLLDPNGPGVRSERAIATDRSVVSHLTIDGAPTERLPGSSVQWLRDRMLVGQAATQVGVAEAALEMTATYTSNRRQFEKPLSTFQGVALKAGDAYIATEAMRVTMWQAAWRLASGLDAADAVLVAKWWAADGGQRVVHITQHLHGGMGADIDYPVHRYFLWGKQLSDSLGGASPTLARLGRVIAGATA
ncbi:MAG: acyl-CoA dehydrogenase [Acidimicrobiales bacterium]|jgi:alkylation response protein AidB-like acyl-CoA dehydrogenase|nr:acyl-CoA dehydrogenase [Acidimicrobiales bacterium]